MSGQIVLGLGGTVDYELSWQADVLQELVDQLGIRRVELEDPPPTAVRGLREAVVAILRSMRHGVGCECYVADPATLEDLASRLRRTVTLGGTCVRAALALDRLGVASTVHLVSVSQEVRRLLPERVERVCSAQGDSLDPHVIVQYPRGARLLLADGVVRAARPNRVILVNDEPNELMRLAPELGALAAGARALLVSGFNTMKSPDLLRQRLAELGRVLAGVRPGATVVYEDAGFHDNTMRGIVLESVPSLAHVHSLNEDEAQLYLGRSVDLSSPVQVADMMGALRQVLGTPAVLVHTSGYAAVVGQDVERLAAAAEAGCLMASTRYRYGDAYGRAEYDVVRGAARNARGLHLAGAAELARAGVLVVPAYEVPTDRATTIGLGDAFIGGVMGALAGRL